MFVCCCLAVSDHKVRETIEGGAHSIDAVTRACGAGGDCGSCHGAIEDMIEDHLESRQGSGPSLVPACSLVRERRERAA